MFNPFKVYIDLLKLQMQYNIKFLEGFVDTMNEVEETVNVKKRGNS